MHIVEQNPLEMLLDSRIPTGLGGRWYGVFPALVSDINDPEGQGRVKVKLPWSPDTGNEVYEVWARLATLMGGNNRGSWFIPDVNDEVLIAFECGDPRRPYVLGGLWNGRDVPPESMDSSGNNYLKVLRSRNGVKIT
ncbi:phage baseplate assembly protein V, partial [candidate division KSB1 bacterium]|nr:phage baseplate assembly protein V [candidate division KSB1 bacterium]